jgi:GntR family transcriptional regulator
MSIDTTSSTPVFQQIAGHVQRLVAAGVFRPGELIPSVRALALELRVNPNTVQRAYQTLESNGLVEAKKGIGMVVTDNGATSAKGRSRAAVLDSFREGIRAGRAAAMSGDHIRDAFEEALGDTDSKVRTS